MHGTGVHHGELELLEVGGEAGGIGASVRLKLELTARGVCSFPNLPSWSPIFCRPPRTEVQEDLHIQLWLLLLRNRLLTHSVERTPAEPTLQNGS